MAEEFVTSALTVPGTYIRVRAEGLIRAGGISVGNVGIVGTADTGFDLGTVLLSDYATAVATFGESDRYQGGAGKLNLTRGLAILFANGAKTVFARALDADENPDKTDFKAALTELLKEDVNILVAPELNTADGLETLKAVALDAEGKGKDLIVVVGSDASALADIKAQAPREGRVLLTTPGIFAFDKLEPNPKTGKNGLDVQLAGNYGAAAVAGLLASLPPQSSPTNKPLAGVSKLSKRYAYGEIEDLINGRLMVLEQKGDVRVVRGITTDDGPWKQVTTRRIVNFAKDGIRKAANPFIGRLNNTRVRKALHGAIDGFLTTMVVDEQLIAYTLDVSATRDDEIGGRAVVIAVLQPTFSIDFVTVTLVLE